MARSARDVRVLNSAIRRPFHGLANGSRSLLRRLRRGGFLLLLLRDLLQRHCGAEFGGSHLGVSLGLTITAAMGAVAIPLIGQRANRARRGSNKGEAMRVRARCRATASSISSIRSG